MIVDCALYTRGVRQHRLDDVFAAAQEAEHEDGFVWIGLVDPSADEFDALAEGFSLPELAIEDAIRAHQRPKLERYGDLTFAIVKPVRYVDHAEVVDVSELAVFVGHRFVVVVRHGDSRIPSRARQTLEGDAETMALGPWAVLHRLLDLTVDQYLEVARAVDVDLDEIEDQVFGSVPGEDHAERIYRLKSEVQQFRRAVVPLVGPVHRLASGQVPGIPGDLQEYFRDVEDHTLRVADSIEAADTLLTGVLQADLAQVTVAQSRVSVQQNADMRKISAWAAIGLVPTAIAGIYGMNVRNLPIADTAFGFWAVLVVIAGSCVLLHRAFRRNRWL
ncbi:magnesium and cobalt transport protein CorA [Cellulomonas sp. H30R-01]|uniref:magnesium and cobalt transport protein CorA n=1 Tax=Cellulomonas sp. H30R-01 TaxID=2704467 RepID=UPI00138B4AD8|nr:magnesium and cobalt transport protein CorA [Cellulomonas sp. H30R-01]QHT57417.1 magnesium and cobalt transport protein CorA [Cellulomonas sp. H30R-01]